MNERVIQFRVGVLVVATAIITAILVMLFGEMQSLVRRQKTVYIEFDSAPGVTVDTPVRKSGILIGRVSDVELLNEGGVLVTARLDATRTVLGNEQCLISTGSLLGDAMLEFVPTGDPSVSTEPINDGDFLKGLVSKDPLDVVRVFANMEEDMVRALGAITSAGAEVGQVARNLNVLVENNQHQFNRIMDRSESAMEGFDNAVTSINNLVSDPDLNANLRRALDGVPQILNEAAELLMGLQQVSDRAEKNLANLEGFTAPLGEAGDDIVASVQKSLNRFDDILEQLTVLSRSVNEGEGTVNQLLNNPDLYQRLNRAAGNIEMLTRRLRPIVEDARVFADKVARNPNRLGVQGALDRRRSGIK